MYDINGNVEKVPVYDVWNRGHKGSSWRTAAQIEWDAYNIQLKIDAAKIEVVSRSDTNITWRVTHSADMYFHIYDTAGIYDRKEYFNSNNIAVLTTELEPGNLHIAVLKFSSYNREVKSITYRTNWLLILMHLIMIAQMAMYLLKDHQLIKF